MAETKGTVTQVLGAVVDVEFRESELPDLYEAIRVPREGQDDLILEVQLHLGHNSVRTVAMDTTDGLQVFSPQSPLGAAIIGAKKGETITYEAPNGKELKVEIVDAVPFTG